MSEGRYKVIRIVEALGEKVLSLFVPKVNAAAACGAYYCGVWDYCQECGTRCAADCYVNCGCSRIYCGATGAACP